MLLDALYSSNKRVKNYRDKEREYREYNRNAKFYSRYYYDKYDNVGKAKEKKEEYYSQKEKMLSILKPTCIHIEQYSYEKERIYDYDKRYRKLEKQDAFVWENCYWDDELCREVWFGDIELEDEPLYHYYLFYDLGGEHTFHSPIDENSLGNYKNLKTINIDKLETLDHEIEDLISNQFVKKILKLIESKDFILKLD